jgi:hypothetical protein
MTPDQQHALFQIENTLLENGAASVVDDYAALLKDTPEHDIDRTCNNIGNIIVTNLRKMSPQMSESLDYGIVFGLVELLKTRLRKSN